MAPAPDVDQAVAGRERRRARGRGRRGVDRRPAGPQWGAGRVIATASTQAKRDLAVDLGAHTAVDVSSVPDADAVRDLLRGANGGHGVDVVLEMTGGVVFDGSLAALAPLGRLAVYGLASRTAPAPVSPVGLMAPPGRWLASGCRTPCAAPAGCRPRWTSSSRSAGRPPARRLGGTFPLADARRAHEDLVSRRTTGKLVLEVVPASAQG